MARALLFPLLLTAAVGLGSDDVSSAVQVSAQSAARDIDLTSESMMADRLKAFSELSLSTKFDSVWEDTLMTEKQILNLAQDVKTILEEIRNSDIKDGDMPMHIKEIVYGSTEAKHKYINAATSTKNDLHMEKSAFHTLKKN